METFGDILPRETWGTKEYSTAKPDNLTTDLPAWLGAELLR